MLQFPTVEPADFKGILIDLDNTLYPFEPAHLQAMQACHPHMPIPAFEDFASLFVETRATLADNPKLQSVCRSRSLIFTNMLDTLGGKKPHHLGHFLETLYWETFLAHMTPCPKAMAFLKKCHSLQKPICLITDMQTYWQIKKLEKLAITHLIDHIVSSEATGCEKPDPLIFQTALNKIQCKPNEAVMIGDHPEKDIKGAKALGIQTYQVLEPN